MVLISKNKKNSCGGVFFFVQLKANDRHTTKNDTPPWMFLFHFAIEKYCLCFQITRSVAQYGFKNWLY